MASTVYETEITGSESAKRALREKDEGILIDGQKKRKSTKNDRDKLKKQKKTLDMCPRTPCSILEYTDTLFGLKVTILLCSLSL